LRSAYNITGTGASSTLIAIVDAFGYPNAERDLGTYRSQFGLPACTTANGLLQKGKPAWSSGQLPSNQHGMVTGNRVGPGYGQCHVPRMLAAARGGRQCHLPEPRDVGHTAAAMGAHAISNSYGGGGVWKLDI